MSKANIYFLDDDPSWYKDAVIYELHVKAFYDSAGDGIGDFRGLTKKLDYIKHLGITAIWLLPFYPSPLRDDGYDIADYYGVHPDYGTLNDFKEFLREAHRRGLKIITELVLNHTSDAHPWFQKSRRAKPGSFWGDFYVWSDTAEGYSEARIIFKDFESSNWSWDPYRKAYYWHRFYSHQPDLNYDNPRVQEAMLQVIDYWLKLGVDGLRLDAVPYLYEREGTNCENLPETHEFLKKLRRHVDGKFTDRMLLAEANQWPEDAAAYFGNGDECQMAFHFPLMPRIFMAIRMEDRFPIIDILSQTPSIPSNCQWAIFLRNHDELTLEMVTDEERDYMYRMYARDSKSRINLGIRRRLAPLMDNDRRKIKLMSLMLFSLPGTPIIYYGDEIGMGDNYYLGDRNGVRTPMQWSPDRNAGFSEGNPQRLFLPVIIDPEYHYEAINVETQELSEASILRWSREFITVRKRFKAFGRGGIEFLYPDNMKILAFFRHYEDQTILVMANLSRHPQFVELDLSKYSGYFPEEIFSRNKFPVIKESPYLLSLNSYGYFWFLLRKEEEFIRMGITRTLPEISVKESWRTVFEGKTLEKLEKEVLPGYLEGCRWFGGKARQINRLEITEFIPVEMKVSPVVIGLIKVEYTEGHPENYFLPLGFAEGDFAGKMMEEHPQIMLARLKVGDSEGILYDGMHHEEFCKTLLAMMVKKRKIKGTHGEIIFQAAKSLKSIVNERGSELLMPQVIKAEQSNTSVLFGNDLFLKVYRRLEGGNNPDVEIIRFLTEKMSLPHVPAFLGSMEYRRADTQPVNLGMLQSYVMNQGDAWKYTLEDVRKYLEEVHSRKGQMQKMPEVPFSLLESLDKEIPAQIRDLIPFYLEMASLLGQRTAELHLALSSDATNPDFAPEPFSILYQRSVFQSMQSQAKKNLLLLKRNIKNLSKNCLDEAEAVLKLEGKIIEQFKLILKKKLSGMKIRIHGDYHLGQVLFTGKDFVVIDFEGEPARFLSERRIKRSPLRDVAGMVRSFHYASHTTLLREAQVNPEEFLFLKSWADLWYRFVSGTFLKSYLRTAGEAPFIPGEKNELETMLTAFLLDKAVYELGYELNNRPEWVIIPLRGIKELVEG